MSELLSGADTPEARSFLDERAKNSQEALGVASIRGFAKKLIDGSTVTVIDAHPYASTCPSKRLMYLIRESYHGPFYVACGKWGCKACGSLKVRAILDNLESKHDRWHSVDVHVIEAYRHAKTVKEALKRVKIKPNTLRLSLRGSTGSGLLLVASEPVSGRGWSTEPTRLKDALALITDRPENEEYTRVGWTGDWKPDHEKDEPSQPTRFSHSYSSVDMMKADLERAGIHLEQKVPTVEQVEILVNLHASDDAVQYYEMSAWAK